MENSSYLVRKAAFKNSSNKFVFVDEVAVTLMDQILPLIGCPQLVDYDYVVDSFSVKLSNYRAADKAGSSGYYIHCKMFYLAAGTSSQY